MACRILVADDSLSTDGLELGASGELGDELQAAGLEEARRCPQTALRRLGKKKKERKPIKKKEKSKWGNFYEDIYFLYREQLQFYVCM
jgi:hypothetical protein